MIYVFIGIAALIVYIVGKTFVDLRENETNKKATAAKFNAYKNNQDKNNVDLEIEKIILYAKKVINNLRNVLDIDYAHLMYEEVFFFFFLNDVKLVDKNVSDDFREKILNRLFESFEYTKNTGYQENRKLIDEIFNLRMKYYAAIYAKYNLKFSPDFFMAIFNYQEELLVSIIKNKTFSYYNPVPSSPMEYSKKESIGIYSNLNIISALTNNIEIITQFIKISE